MLRTLRAFAWLRWRIFINSLQHTSARDSLERFSLALERLAPILMLVVMIPSAIALGALSAYAGLTIAQGGSAPVVFEFLRYMLLAVSAFCIVGPILLPVADRTNPVRLLLLPIARSTLYLTQVTGAIADPWILIVVPIAVGLPLGFIAAGEITAGVLALAAGLLIFATLVGISSLTTSAVHLLMRDRRRGELVALFFIIVLPLLSVLPAAFDSMERDQRRRERVGQTRAERTARPWPVWVEREGALVFRVLPSELYTRAVRDSIAQDGRPVLPIAALAAIVLLLHGAGIATFRRVLDSPASSGGRRAVARGGSWGAAVPGVTRGTSAVALAHLRLAFRTPRGRSILLSPVLMFLVFAFVVRRSGPMDFGPLSLQSGLGLATFGAFVALLSILPVAMNQFAVDGAGLTLQLLSPLRTRELLAGKAIGNTLISLPPAILCVVLSAVIFPGGSLALWAALPIALLAITVVVAPVAAIFSAIFPRVVDMNSIGQRSNAHGLAGLFGLFTFLAAGLPCLFATLLATKLFQKPSLAPLFMAIWCATGLAIAKPLFALAEKIFDKRRENLATLM